MGELLEFARWLTVDYSYDFVITSKGLIELIEEFYEYKKTNEA